MSDAGQFEPFYRAAYPRLVGQVFALTGSLPEAEDVAQEAFVRTMRHWPQVRAYDAPESWVRRVAFNLAANRRRGAQRGRRALARLGPPPEVPAVGIEVVSLVAALRQLSLRYREVLVLHYLVDMPVDAIAAELGVPSGTVKTRLARGRTALAALLAPEPEPTAIARPSGGGRFVARES